MFCVYSVTNTSDSYQAEQHREKQNKDSNYKWRFMDLQFGIMESS